MAVLNVRGLDESLVASVKAAAARDRVTLREYVAGVLASAVGKVRESAPRPALARMVDEVSNPTAAVERALAHGRPGHDPKTCRVYRCGLCAAAKQ